jgi:hypothetical protein
MTTLLSSVRQTTLALLATCATGLPGCIAIPVPIALPDPEPFTAASMASIRVGETTRDEVRALLANWSYETDDGSQTIHLEPQISEDGRHWVFNLPRPLADVLWAGVGVTPDGFFPIWSGGADNYENFWVLFEFDDDAKVTRFWFTGDRTQCAVGGACYHDGHLQVVADEAADRSARARSAASDRCVVYVYASDDFQFPVAVSDGRDSRRLFAKTSYARFDLTRDAAMPTAWYENAPGSAVTLPIECVGGGVHYVALRSHAGLIEAAPEDPSVGRRAIEKRYLVEHLVPARPSQPSEERPSIWTNCTAADPCRELATLDTVLMRYYRTSAVVVAPEQSYDRVDYMLLHPGRYSVQSSIESSAEARDDTLDLEAGRRYQARHRVLACGKRPKSYSAGRRHSDGEEALAPLCAHRESWDSVSTTWIEDAATGRVVAGAKWCVSVADCPESTCSLQAGESSGVCDIPELQ